MNVFRARRCGTFSPSLGACNDCSACIRLRITGGPAGVVRMLPSAQHWSRDQCCRCCCLHVAQPSPFYVDFVTRVLQAQFRIESQVADQLQLVLNSSTGRYNRGEFEGSGSTYSTAFSDTEVSAGVLAVKCALVVTGIMATTASTVGHRGSPRLCRAHRLHAFIAHESTLHA